MVVANHASILDTLVFLAALAPSFVAKESTRETWFVGTPASLLQCVFVPRRAHGSVVDGAGNPAASTGGTSDAIVARARAFARDGHLPPTVVFPEGTTTNNTSIIHFRTGVFRVTDTPIQPVGVVWRWGRSSPTWESIPWPIYAWRLLSAVETSVVLHWCPPVGGEEAAGDSDGAPRRRRRDTRDDATESALQSRCRAAREAVSRATGLPLVDASAADKWELHRQILAGELDWRWWAVRGRAGGAA